MKLEDRREKAIFVLILVSFSVAVISLGIALLHENVPSEHPECDHSCDCGLTHYDLNITVTETEIEVTFGDRSHTFCIDDRITALIEKYSPVDISLLSGTYTLSFLTPPLEDKLAMLAGHYTITIEVVWDA